ncbi:hypothetical protein MLD38_005780 [Melastoma candidum]|uniref:Uncharacterized protein n=1 Tax=Melastoma candidum TaxID=119954 RepID=A0ACB9RLC1_9MYRT|nr:hypothetical protein MLD38_005780 [Melastoma candidum]
MEPLAYEEQDELRTPETQPSKRRKKSIVWDHFTIENVSPGIRRACCKQCNQTFAYSQGSKVSGTSHLKRHIAKGTCPTRLRNGEKSHVALPPAKMDSDAPKWQYRTSPVALPPAKMDSDAPKWQYKTSPVVLPPGKMDSDDPKRQYRTSPVALLPATMDSDEPKRQYRTSPVALPPDKMNSDAPKRQYITSPVALSPAKMDSDALNRQYRTSPVALPPAKLDSYALNRQYRTSPVALLPAKMDSDALNRHYRTYSDAPKRQYRTSPVALPPAKMDSDALNWQYNTSPAPYVPLDQDRCRQAIVKMIIMQDYPLHMVEHAGFVSFVQNLQPQFESISFSAVQGDCIAAYLTEKQALMKFIEGMPGCCCLTVDRWTSSQNLGYLFLTVHFMDHDWKMQRRLLNVVVEPFPEPDDTLSNVVATCLGDWNLETKLFSVTFNQALSQTGTENLRAFLTNKNPSILNGQLLLGNCIACTLSAAAKDLLVAGQDIIKKVRNSVKYVKSSESREEKFEDLRQQLQVPSDKSLELDDTTRWNMTCEMLMAASELKEVFTCLDTLDPEYQESPSLDVWNQVEILCTHLKPIYDAASILVTTRSPTAANFFHEVWKIRADLARAVTSDDPFGADLTKLVLEKIDKYWKDCCLVLAMAVVMDPRFKMKLVEFSFTKIFGEEGLNYVKLVENSIHELFLEYVSLPQPPTPTYNEEGSMGNSTKTDESGGPLLTDHGLTDFDVYIMETSGQHMKSEVDQYLDENLSPRVPDFDVLGWWKTNMIKYPTLSKMARDILSIPVSTVPSELVFDLTNREMDRYKCTLRPETMEALLCAKDWLQCGSTPISNTHVDVKMELSAA